MNRTYKFKLNPDAAQRELLRRTMTQFNKACTWTSKVAFENKCFSKFSLQKLVYGEMRNKFKLPSQLAIRAVSKTASSHKNHLRRKSSHVFRNLGSMDLDARSFSLPKRNPGFVSILTLNGRTVIPCNFWKELSGVRVLGDTKLLWDKPTKSWFVSICVEILTPTISQATEWIGIDLGVVNLATLSDGTNFSGGDTEKTRKRLTKVKSSLQSCGTKSARRHLSKISKREANFKKTTNHVISKIVVSKAAKAPGTGIRLENLTGIGKTVSAKPKYPAARETRAKLGKWAFGQLSYFIAYKAEAAGVPIEWVNPAYTSQTCSACGHISAKNRPTREEFECTCCGFRSDADLNAAINISKGEVNAPNVDVRDETDGFVNKLTSQCSAQAASPRL